MKLMDTYSDNEFQTIIKQSKNYHECLIKLGYKSSSGSSIKLLKQKIEKLGIDTSHFTTKTPVKRTEENVFCKDSTANQATLRRWYVKGEYTEYKCAICGQEPFWNNKAMTLILDHINGDNHDDRLENLRWVCGNCNMQLDTTNGKNRYYKQTVDASKKREQKLKFCIDCGKVISQNALRCSECAAKAERVVEWPTREELKQLIRTIPFTTIGKRFGVSDNAVRKWCKKYDLPQKVSEIKKYTDEEWLNI